MINAIGGRGAGKVRDLIPRLLVDFDTYVSTQPILTAFL